MRRLRIHALLAALLLPAACARPLGIEPDPSQQNNNHQNNSNDNANTNSNANANFNFNTNHNTNSNQRCQDEDGDGYGEGPDCLGPDCNQQDPTCWAVGSACCSRCDLLDDDSDGYGLFASCAGLDCDDSNPQCSTAGQPCCRTGPLDCSSVVQCGLNCNWPGDAGCAQDCYERGTTQAQLQLEQIQACTATSGCGNDPQCIQSACPAEVSLCLGALAGAR